MKQLKELSVWLGFVALFSGGCTLFILLALDVAILCDLLPYEIYDDLGIFDFSKTNFRRVGVFSNHLKFFMDFSKWICIFRLLVHATVAPPTSAPPTTAPPTTAPPTLAPTATPPATPGNNGDGEA